MSSPITEDEKHLDWSAKQGRILTDRGKALKYYSEENGFPFASEVSDYYLLWYCVVSLSETIHSCNFLQELPHYHLEIGDSNETYRKWSDEHHSSGIKCPIIGAWKRPLFTGKWEHSTDEDEVVFNIQTSTLFIDLRIPKSKPIHKWENMGKRSIGIGMKSCRDILQSFSDHDLRLYARQHVFGGFSVLSREKFKSLPLCTRHHCIDWNYVTGKPRPRPNKWYIEGDRSSTDVDKPFDVWKEWSYARDDNGQCYYWERWERLLGDQQGNGLRLALRKRSEGRDNQRWLNTSDGRWLNISDKSRNVDGILVAVGVSQFWIKVPSNCFVNTRYFFFRITSTMLLDESRCVVKIYIQMPAM